VHILSDENIGDIITQLIAKRGRNIFRKLLLALVAQEINQLTEKYRPSGRRVALIAIVRNESRPSPLPSQFRARRNSIAVNYCCVTASLCRARAPPSLSLRNPFRPNSAAALWKRANSPPPPPDASSPRAYFGIRDLKRTADWSAALFIRSARTRSFSTRPE